MKEANILLTPGPTIVPDDVLQVMAEPIFHHRTPQYRKLFEEVSNDLKLVFRTKHPVYTFTGSGTAAMEASVVNFLSPGDCVISIETGKFGERWTSLAKAFQMKPVVLKAPYGSVVPPEEVAEALRKNPDVKAVCATLCETSTGALSDIKKIAEVVSKTDAILIVDAISGLAADVLEMDGWNIDVVVSGSQKGLMVPPGLAFLSANEKAWKLNETAKCLRYYLNLAAYRKSLGDWDTPYTPALTLVLGLQLTLRRLKEEGMENVWKRCAKVAGFTRAQMTGLGLELFTKQFSNAVTAIIVPEGIDGKKLVSVIRDKKGITLAGGQGDMTGKIFRICHFGIVNEEHVRKATGVIKETIDELRSGAGMQKVQ